MTFDFFAVSTCMEVRKQLTLLHVRKRYKLAAPSRAFLFGLLPLMLGMYSFNYCCPGHLLAAAQRKLTGKPPIHSVLQSPREPPLQIYI